MTVKDILVSHKQGFYKKGKQSEGDVHFVRISDINNNFYLDKQSTPMIEVQNSDVDRFDIKEGDFLFARTGGAGRFCLIQEDIHGVFASYLIRFRFNKQNDPRFLRYFFMSNSFQKELKSKIHGGVNQNVHAENIKDCHVPTITLPEQKAIVKILDEAFAKIDQAKANIEKNIANAKELFQSKLNDIFSQRGEGWEEKTLIEISKEFGRGKSKHRPRNAEVLFGGDYPFVQTGEVRNSDKYITTFKKTYNDTGLAQSKLWPKGTICITIAANIAETAILKFDACFPDSIIGLIVDSKKATNNYSFYALLYLKSELQSQGKGSAQSNINLGTFKNQLFPFPDIDRQEEIALILDAIRIYSEKISKIYQLKIRELEDLKKSLLQKAFAGELTKSEAIA